MIGQTSDGEDVFAVDQQELTVPIVSRSVCNSIAQYSGYIAREHLCAGRVQGGIDSCFGDSGGPLFYKDTENSLELIMVGFLRAAVGLMCVNGGGKFSQDDAGHLMARRFDGYNKRGNFVAQNINLNRGRWQSDIETGVSFCENNPFRTIFYQASVNYGFPIFHPFGLRPTRFFAFAVVTDYFGNFLSAQSFDVANDNVSQQDVANFMSWRLGLDSDC